MKKFLKIFGISIAAVIGLLIILTAVVCRQIFTPERLSSIIREQAAKIITCQNEIGNVELTFFRTFPQLGININHVCIINPTQGAQSDTLLYLEELIAKIDAGALWKNNTIIVDEIQANKLLLNAFINEKGKSNYDVFLTDDAEKDTIEKSEPFSLDNIPFNMIKMDKAGFYKINVSYCDRSSGIMAGINTSDAEIRLKYRSKKAEGMVDFSIPELYIDMDIDTASNIKANIKKLHTGLKLWYADRNTSGTLKMETPDISVDFNGEKLLSSNSLSVIAPISDITRTFINITAEISLDEIDMTSGIHLVLMTDRYIITNISLKLQEVQISDLMAFIPPSLSSAVDSIDADGLISFEGAIIGAINDTLLPPLFIDLTVENTKLKYKPLPFNLHNINGNIFAYINPNNNSMSKSHIEIKSVSAATGRSSFNASGMIFKPLSEDMIIDIKSNINLFLSDFQNLIPNSLQAGMAGRIQGPVNARLSMPQLLNMDIKNMNITGSLGFTDFVADLDTIHAQTDKLKLNFIIPDTSSKANMVHSTIHDCEKLSVNIGKSVHTVLHNPDLSLQLSDIINDTTEIKAECDLSVKAMQASVDNISSSLTDISGNASINVNRLDTTAIPEINCNLRFANINGTMDTVSVDINDPALSLSLSGRDDDKGQIKLFADYTNSSLSASLGKNTLSSSNLRLTAEAQQDSTKKNILLQWNPKLQANLKECNLYAAPINEIIHIPHILFDFDNQRFIINESKFLLGSSDFRLKGTINNIDKFLNDTGLLEGQLDFTSEKTDVNYLMSLVSGFGTETDTAAVKSEPTAAADTSQAEELNPFMVPKKVDLVLNTKIKEAVVGKQVANNLGGKLYIKDGILVLEEMGFISKAAKLNLTALYKSPRKNHLFAGIDFHMVDIHIDELLKMIPDIDSVLPMLKAFKGQAEFHLAAESYLYGNYNLKKSSLLGSASLHAKDLVVLDNETFKKISRILLFSKKTDNVIDSLFAEINVYEDMVDVYPLALSMDKYQAILGGRHNLDMSFDYHISLTKSPLPFRLGVNITGTPDDLKIRPARCKYDVKYRPERRYAVNNKQMELRKLIRESLSGK